ncbi:hypothetical protein AJ87_34910 [Rhizobium yanglingense]|nr:hypothetical protein AJ87_34910 [Rhizobium yanglingense]
MNVVGGSVSRRPVMDPTGVFHAARQLSGGICGSYRFKQTFGFIEPDDPARSADEIFVYREPTRPLRH